MNTYQIGWLLWKMLKNGKWNGREWNGMERKWNGMEQKWNGRECNKQNGTEYNITEWNGHPIKIENTLGI